MICCFRRSHEVIHHDLELLQYTMRYRLGHRVIARVGFSVRIIMSDALLLARDIPGFHPQTNICRVEVVTKLRTVKGWCHKDLLTIHRQEEFSAKDSCANPRLEESIMRINHLRSELF